ncbi:unnamed protein product [Schistosoma mattheei]|uniref:Uncharacterized protein n=1 Tax=Schistosoma mattheei TaxID=31246 RepID=A0A183PXH3_9TREM|nr:unnamed protein product [Schistosoma mattheei]
MLIMPAGIDMSTYLIQDIHSIDAEAYINFTKEALLGGTTTIGKMTLPHYNVSQISKRPVNSDQRSLLININQREGESVKSLDLSFCSEKQ